MTWAANQVLVRCVDAIGGGGELRAIEFELLLDDLGRAEVLGQRVTLGHRLVSPSGS